MPTGKSEVSGDGGVSNDSLYRRPGAKRVKPNRKLNSITGVGMLRAGFCVLTLIWGELIIVVLWIDLMIFMKKRRKTKKRRT